MENKIAIFTKGIPLVNEDPEKFNRDSNLNFNIIKEILDKEGYLIREASLDEIVHYWGPSTFDKDSDILFYFTGHANGTYVGTFDFKIQDVLNFFIPFNGKKYLILDACAGRTNFDLHDFPQNSITLTANSVYNSKSIAKLLYDFTIVRGNKLEDLSQDKFNELKLDWVKCVNHAPEFQYA
jgi:hypothetical protein